MLAIKEALKRVFVCLLGIPFKFVTDCSAFEKTMDIRDLATCVACRALLLKEFNNVIELRSSAEMPHVDALSRFLADII